MDGPRILNSETGRSKNIKVDGPKVLKWTFKKCHGPKMWTCGRSKNLNSGSGRSGNTKVDGPDA